MRYAPMLKLISVLSTKSTNVYEQSHQRTISQITLAPCCNLFTTVILPSPSWIFLGIPKGSSYIWVSSTGLSAWLLITSPWYNIQALKMRGQVWFTVVLCKLRKIPHLLLYLGYLNFYFVLLLDMFDLHIFIVFKIKPLNYCFYNFFPTNFCSPYFLN